VNLLKKLSGLFAATASKHEADSCVFTVTCGRCGEVLRTRINPGADLSPDYDEGENVTAYYCRKVLIGKQHCFQPIEVTLKFDARHQLTDKQIAGGKFVE